MRHHLPFSERFPPWRACKVGVRYPPPPKGYLSDTRATPYENKANGCDTPLCDTISEGYCAIWGGISHWAAKVLFPEMLGGTHFCNGPSASELIEQIMAMGPKSSNTCIILGEFKVAMAMPNCRPKTQWTFRYFQFFLLGEGKGESEALGRGAGGRLFYGKFQGGRGGLLGGRGGQGPGGCLQGIWGGGVAKYFFFRGRNSHQEKVRTVVSNCYRQTFCF